VGNHQITPLAFIEIGCACGIIGALKVILLARNRLIGGR
jgi:hypothetical protein